ncbi:hypothetical protein SPACI_049700 [Sporomusa acidovorans DSM 3132]|uniref:Uncharacterized protein n=1 Tax=Sporomusa acidovorans (strain ATCC 49682 / DSM 3132 / Mol) TaxID=1123286 RepID=A0ABZ3J8Y5_SPOA4|nr:hypothetical protein SPACI_46160 [Sporomusa acidovorans DSM 3132]SDE32608.1 hypothetical protein SAMN04488499_1011117 [Sporomusa acidovorans]
MDDNCGKGWLMMKEKQNKTQNNFIALSFYMLYYD